MRAVADEIAAVQGKIDGVEGQVKEVGDKITGIMAAKSEGWGNELAYWWKHKKQLVEEKWQLREEKKLLREEELFLMKRDDVK